MEITIIGSGTGVPSRRRSSPCVAVHMGNNIVLLDSGPGSLRKMLEADITYNDIYAVHYTHTHVDHVNDLAQLLFASKYDENPRTRPLVLTGPPGFKEFYERLVSLYGDQVVSGKYELTIEELSDNQKRYDGYLLVSKPTIHMIPSTGYRIEDSEGHAVVYTGDTSYCEEAVELARNADILIIEAALPPGKKLKGHMEPEVAGRIASEAGIDTLVITHLYPICDRFDTEREIRKSFQGNLLVAEDLLHIEM